MGTWWEKNKRIFFIILCYCFSFSISPLDIVIYLLPEKWTTNTDIS